MGGCGAEIQKEACILALGKAKIRAEQVRCLYGGDLLRQGIATSMGAEELQIPMFGLFGACSTSGEALALAAMACRRGTGSTCWLSRPAISGRRKRNSGFP